MGDNPALDWAVAQGAPIIPLYILDDETPGRWAMGGASRWWLHHSLASLGVSIAEKGGALILKRGEVQAIIEQLVEELNPQAVVWNRCYEPYAIARDKAIKESLGDVAKSFNGSLLFEPWEVETGAGEPYKVYTPFWKACMNKGVHREPIRAPQSVEWAACESDDLDDWTLLPTAPDWSKPLQKEWTIGEEGAKQALYNFLDGAVENYSNGRDMPGMTGTSKLSPHLHFGEISPLQIYSLARYKQDERDGAVVRKHIDKFLSEIGWREFAYHLLYHFDDFAEQPFRKEFEGFPWADDDATLKQWQRGMTGYPIVDAGMRELWQTGWMHNRVRMIVASFLTKDLLIPWQEGAKWFWDTLVDADLANNSAGWQWTAGCGADAAPYFRVFNPVLQSKKFDGDGEYIRKYVPELAKLSGDALHAPWEADEDVLKAAGVVLGKDYPKPIVNHGKARDRALEAYKVIKKS